jgi:hypothetical protein
MSPEQARGKAVDRRTDVWAFGCCLYEALTGQKSYEGETHTERIAAVLSRDPDWEALPRQTPPRIRDLLRRCLQRDSQRRWGTSACGSRSRKPWRARRSGAIGRRHRPPPVRWRRVLPQVWRSRWAAAVALPGPRRERACGAPSSRSPCRPAPPWERTALAFSPDGKQLVYVATTSWALSRGAAAQVRAMDQLGAPITGTEGAAGPFFPDGQWIGLAGADRALRRCRSWVGPP